jgi:ubiquinone/menaquinone biosynthesis C-methylase UbiE
MAPEDVKKHFHLNSKDYDDKMGTGDHNMMHYGDHSDYDRNILEKFLRIFGVTTLKEIKHSVVNRVKALAEKADIDDNDLVVDSGCGRGGNAIWLAKNTGAEVIGLDIDEDLLDRARKNTEDQGVDDKVKFRKGDFDELPVSNFDVYFAIESQCYSKDKEELVQKIYESLNQGGRVIISDGYRTKNYTESDEELADKMHKGWGVEKMANREDFEKYLKKAGFQNVEVESIQEKIAPTSKYLHRLSIISIPYVNTRILLASMAETISEKIPLLDEEPHSKSKERYKQVKELLTTGRYQYIAGKKGIFDQFDFYAEKPDEN